jgi:hypothetical protein
MDSAALRRTVRLYRRGVAISIVVAVAIGACAPNRPASTTGTARQSASADATPATPVLTEYSCGPTTPSPSFNFADASPLSCSNAPNYGCLVFGGFRAPENCDPKPQLDKLNLEIHCCFASAHAPYGPVTLWVRIDHEGVVENAGIEPDRPPGEDAALEACLRKLLLPQRFPSCGSQTTFFEDLRYRFGCWG